MDDMYGECSFARPCDGYGLVAVVYDGSEGKRGERRYTELVGVVMR